MRSLLYEELVRRGYFPESPQETRTNWRNRALRSFVILPSVGFLVWAVFFRGVGWFWLPLGALIAITVAIYLISGALPRKTWVGAEAAAKWRAFRRYLENIEKYDKVAERNEVFDAYLPYAVAFGLERSWVGAFARAGAPAPRWYAPVWPTGGTQNRSGHSLSRWGDDREWDGTSSTGHSWWDVTGGDRQTEEHGGGGGGFGLPDWQGTSDHAAHALSQVSDGLLSLFNAAGNALSSMADAAAKSDWGSRSGGSDFGGGGSRGSFGGGGSSGGSSGGGSRGFGSSYRYRRVGAVRRGRSPGRDHRGERGRMRTTSPVEVLVSGYDSPEGPAFDRDGNLFFVNWLTSSIVKLAPDGQASEFFNTGGIPAGLAFHPDGSLYVADEGDQIHGVMRITPSGEASIVVNEYQGKPLNGANDLVFDRNGVLYFSDPWGTSAENPVGGFYRLFPDGTLEQIDRGLAFPNGVALTADGSAVILAETYRNRLLRYAIRPDDSVGPREHWADTHLPSGPDGMAFDANGDLYVAHFGAGCVDVFDPTGARVDEILVPGEKPTNVAFGPDGTTVVITEVATASLYRVRLNVAGQPLHDGR